MPNEPPCGIFRELRNQGANVRPDGDLGIFHGVMAAMPALDAQGFVVTPYVQFLPRVAGFSIVIASHQVQFDFLQFDLHSPSSFLTESLLPCRA